MSFFKKFRGKLPADSTPEPAGDLTTEPETMESNKLFVGGLSWDTDDSAATGETVAADSDLKAAGGPFVPGDVPQDGNGSGTPDSDLITKGFNPQPDPPKDALAYGGPDTEPADDDSTLAQLQETSDPNLTELHGSIGDLGDAADLGELADVEDLSP